MNFNNSFICINIFFPLYFQVTSTVEFFLFDFL
jgi:hypothetical protein